MGYKLFLFDPNKFKIFEDKRSLEQEINIYICFGQSFRGLY